MQRALFFLDEVESFNKLASGNSGGAGFRCIGWISNVFEKLGRDARASVDQRVGGIHVEKARVGLGDDDGLQNGVS